MPESGAFVRLNPENSIQALPRNNKRKESFRSKHNKRLKAEPIISTEKVKSKHELHKQPTAEEISLLKETENLFHSNLFRLKIDELLAAVNLKKKYHAFFIAWYQNFSSFIENLPDYEDVISLNCAKHIKTKKRLKFDCNSLKSDQDLVLKFVKPETHNCFGLYKVNAIIEPIFNINVVMPKSCLLRKDYLNNRYFIKRNYYLSYIASELSKTELCADMALVFDYGHQVTNILEILPNGCPKIKIRIHITTEPDYFKFSRFEPNKNNVKADVFNSELPVEDLQQQPNPFYNSLLLNDITLSANQQALEKAFESLTNVQDGIKLLQVWLKQRNLSAGFSLNILSYVVLYLVVQRKVNTHMSSYQVVRNFWIFMCNSEWHEQPISLCSDVKPDHLKLYQDLHELVFLDETGYNNLAAFLNKEIYVKVKQESGLAVKMLDDNRYDAFEVLFMTKMPAEIQYDVLLSIKNLQDCNLGNVKTIQKHKYQGFDQLLILKQITDSLKKGLNKRADNIVPLFTQVNLNLVEEAVFEQPSFDHLIFGIKLNLENAFRVIEIGPPPYNYEAKNFCEFWGELSELRRFKDGSTNEAVYFETNTVRDKRQICKKMINHIATKVLKLSDFNLYFDEFESVFENGNVILPFPSGVNEEACGKVTNIFDDLSKKLRALDLPLEITSVQGASDSLSYTEVFPPVPTTYKWGDKLTMVKENNIVFKESKPLIVPPYASPVECVIQLSLHSKWPQDLNATKQIKTAFYLKISELLKEQFEINSNVRLQYLDIYHEGLIFRCKLYHSKELTALKKGVTSEGLTAYKDTEESLNYEMELNILPKIYGALNGIHSQYPSFGPSAALIKRWVRSQLLDSFHIPDVVINLLLASLYVNGYTTPNLPQVAFLRFLKLVSETDWNLQSFIVNFNDEINREQIIEIETKIQQNRQAFPPLLLLTPFDTNRFLLTKNSPSKEVLKRFSALAKGVYKVVQDNIVDHRSLKIKPLFVPNLSGYNVIIHLNPFLNARRHQQVNKLDNPLKIEEHNPRNKKIPIAGFNPVEIYLNCLRKSFSELALFFYDTYGGDFITVLWKPKASQVLDFKLFETDCKKVKEDKLVFNIDAVLEDFYILSDGLVKNIEVK